MLKSLTVKNIALIESAEIEFCKGLNVLSGETGAGKSIIIDSLGFVLGERADKTLIRHGASEASVTAEFFVRGNILLKNLLEEFGLEFEDELLVQRDISADGAGISRVNGSKVTLNMLKRITECVADVYSQHETHALFLESNHINILDGFAVGLKPLKDKVAEKHRMYSALKNKQKTLGNARDISIKRANLELSIDEITSANLQIGEEEELERIRARVLNAENYIDCLSNAHEFLSGDENEKNILISIASALKFLTQISGMDKDLPELIERVTSAKIELQDISAGISDLLNSAEFDEEVAKKSEERKDEIRVLKRKYGADIREILDNLQKMREEYEFLLSTENDVEKLENEISKAKDALEDAANELSNARKLSAKKLEIAIISELAEVGLGGARFEVVFLRQEVVTPNGFDGVAFNVSLNKGQPLKSLAKTVSGGEGSRFMLCLKNIIASLSSVDTMVFDEIDTGISGKIASAVAGKLYKISKERQVLAVTHLPQLAAMADVHYLIEKTNTDKNTFTRLTKLSKDAEIIELARLVGANEKSEFAIPHAREMKRFADEFKQNISKK